jgi:glycosyltransferase involved in cell wall biosynthesis
MKRESSGLAYTTLDLVKYTERLGHQVAVKEPTGGIIYGTMTGEPDMHTIHSQLDMNYFFDNKVKAMWMHGECLSSVGNGVSMRAICDLAPKMDFFVCMRRTEWPIWSSIKRTYLVRKGIDLERFKPADEPVEKLSGSPAVLIYENIRQNRNPLFLCKAIEIVHKTLPEARLHIYNVQDKRTLETFQALIKECKWWLFIRSLQGPVEHTAVPGLIARADIVVSCLFPYYARSVESLGCGKAFISAGYSQEFPDYPWYCDYSPESMADAIIKCWSDYQKVNYRQRAIDLHSAADMAHEAVDIYERYLGMNQVRSPSMSLVRAS